MKDLEISRVINEMALEKDAGERMIEVLLKDKESQQIIGKKVIKRALLAKFMQPLTEHNISAYNGKFVMEI